MVEEKFSLKKFLFGKLNRKFIFIFGIILIAILLIGGLIIYFQEQVLQEQFLKSITETEEDFHDTQIESIRTLSATLEVILQDEQLKQIYLEKDREKLFDYGQPLFQNLKEEYQITHFYFILPNGTNFVRIHNKEKFGDLIQRATFLKAKETKETSAGIELGQTAYALRVVMPYYNQGILIGYVELGQEIDEFLNTMKKGKFNEFSIVVKKNNLNEDDWISVREVQELRNNWNDLKEEVIIAQTTEEFFSCFSNENIGILRKQTSFLERSNLNGKVFACGGFGLIDASNAKSGVIFSLIDVTEQQKEMYGIRYVLLIILFGIILIFIGIGIYINKTLAKPIKKLNLATEELRKKNFTTRVDIKTGDELEKLGESFNQTTQALENMDKEYKQLEKAKTEFLSITSHELRSPMTPMQAQLQMLLGDYYGKLNEKQRQSLEIVARNTKRLDNIIVDFLEISRIEAARLKFRFVKKDLVPYITLLTKEMSGFMPEKKIKIISEIEKLPIIEADPDRVMQVLRNLINNAMKFSKENTSIVVSAKLQDGMILFSVKDHGIGIKPEDQKRIFEPFYQAEQTIYREHQGTGLGLAIIRGIVESQNGKVWLESKKEVGTTFYFTLPLKPVREIKPIKILFSNVENQEKEIKEMFVEILGPMGIQEFESLSQRNQIDKKNLIWYANFLLKKGILFDQKAEIFKGKILEIFGEKPVSAEKISTESLIKKGLIKSSPEKSIAEKLREQGFVKERERERLKKQKRR